MPTNRKTPGVYINEENAFFNSIIGAPTALPLFVGYTEKANLNGKDYTNKPVLVSNLSEYSLYFGGAPNTIFSIAKEENKHGFSKNEVIRHFEELSPKEYENINFCGVMGMATFINDSQIIELEFKKLREIFQSLKETYFKNKEDFKEISMGMSQDYPLAIKQGSTMIRIGSSLFGSRNP